MADFENNQNEKERQVVWILLHIFNLYQYEY